MTTSAPTGYEHETPVKITTVSATERASFRRCRRRWFLTTAHRLQPAMGNPNFWFGTLVHAGLEAYYNTLAEYRGHGHAALAARAAYHAAYEESVAQMRQDLGWLWPEAASTYEEMRELGDAMLLGYLEREKLAPVVKKVVDVEVRVLVPIRAPGGRRVGWLTVKTDLVGEDERGELTVVDHKTATGEANETQLDMDDQLTAEVYAVWKTKKRFPTKAIYNVLLKKVPHPPERLKSGKFSVNKQALTTYDLFVETVRAAGQSPNDYAEHLSWLREQEAQGSRFYQREVTFRTPGQMEQFEANLYHEFLDMKAVGAKPEKAYPNPSPFNCPRCEVKAVCQAMMDGSDAGTLIANTLAVGEPRY